MSRQASYSTNTSRAHKKPCYWELKFFKHPADSYSESSYFPSESEVANQFKTDPEEEGIPEFIFLQPYKVPEDLTDTEEETEEEEEEGSVHYYHCFEEKEEEDSSVEYLYTKKAPEPEDLFADSEEEPEEQEQEPEVEEEEEQVPEENQVGLFDESSTESEPEEQDLIEDEEVTVHIISDDSTIEDPIGNRPPTPYWDGWSDCTDIWAQTSLKRS